MTRKISAAFGFLIYCILLSLSHGVPMHGTKVRIAHKNEVSFVVSILRTGPNNQRAHFCAGSFVSKKSVLTAGHCLIKKNIAQVEIIAIIDDRFERFVPESWISFDHWKNRNAPDKYSMHDIAMITIKGEIKNAAIVPATLVLTEPHNFYHSHVRIASSGRADDSRHPLNVKTALMTVITNKECIEKGRKSSGNENFGISSDYFCTEADSRVITVCGDSGAPVLDHENHVVGIHTGVCPSLQGYPEEYKHENHMKNHLRLYRYSEFINRNKR